MRVMYLNGKTEVVPYEQWRERRDMSKYIFRVMVQLKGLRSL